MLLLSATLEEIRLGPLLRENINDWIIALSLAQPTLRVLKLPTPITLRPLQILSDQCPGDHVLGALKVLNAGLEGDIGHTLASVVPLMSDIKALYVTLLAPTNDQPWCVDPEFFSNLGRMEQVDHLCIHIDTISIIDNDGELVYTSITGADLINLSRLPLTILAIQPCYRRAYHTLELRQITGSDLLYVLRHWQSLELMSRGDLQRTTGTRTSRHSLDYGQRGIPYLSDPSIWLGRNSNFCPEPLKWEPRQLYHAGDRREACDLVELPEEAEDPVWGEEMEPHVDDDAPTDYNLQPARDTESNDLGVNPHLQEYSQTSSGSDVGSKTISRRGV